VHPLDSCFIVTDRRDAENYDTILPPTLPPAITETARRSPATDPASVERRLKG